MKEWFHLVCFSLPVVYLVVGAFYWLGMGEWVPWTLCGKDELGYFKECSENYDGLVGLSKILNFIGNHPLFLCVMIAAVPWLDENL